VGGTGRAGGSSGAVVRQGPITGALLGADGIQLGVLVRVTLRDSRSLSVGQMDRSLLLGGVVCIGVFYALLTGDFIVILMSVVAGYVIHTLLG
jgi:hypothetical protein